MRNVPEERGLGMYSKQITIQNRSGLHARPAADFVSQAGKFKAKIGVQRAGEDVVADGKSIIMLLAMGLAQGEGVILSADGEDEKEAVEALAEVLANCRT